MILAGRHLKLVTCRRGDAVIIKVYLDAESLVIELDALGALLGGDGEEFGNVGGGCGDGCRLGPEAILVSSVSPLHNVALGVREPVRAGGIALADGAGHALGVSEDAVAGLEGVSEVSVSLIYSIVLQQHSISFGVLGDGHSGKARNNDQLHDGCI